MNKNNTSDCTADMIRTRRMRLSIRAEYRRLAWKAVGFWAVVYLVFTQAFLVTRNAGLGMFPALKDGDLLIAYRLERDYARNDVVVYSANGRQETGRVIAGEGDVVEMDQNGTLRVNGTVQSGEILYPTYAKEKEDFSYQVPEKQVFILGDFRTNTADSRDYGSIPVSDIRGKVITILRRRGL